MSEGVPSELCMISKTERETNKYLWALSDRAFVASLISDFLSFELFDLVLFIPHSFPLHFSLSAQFIFVCIEEQNPFIPVVDRLDIIH